MSINIETKEELLESFEQVSRDHFKLKKVLLTVYEVGKADPGLEEFESYEEAVEFIRGMDIGNIYRLKFLIEPYQNLKFMKCTYEVKEKDDGDWDSTRDIGAYSLILKPGPRWC